MRRSRSLLGVANFSRQLGRHKVINTSSLCLNPVPVETYDVVPGSIMQWRGKSHTASLPSYSPEMKRRKVSKDERRPMVEKYVNNYREMNGGKFPTATDAKNNVGGSYYVVKRILEELRYNCEISSMHTKDGITLEKGAMKKGDICIHPQKASQTRKPKGIIHDGKPFVDMLDSRHESRLISDICEDNENSVDILLAEKATEENGLSFASVESLNRLAKVDLLDLGDEKHEVFLKTNVNKGKNFTEVLRKSVIVDESITKLHVDHQQRASEDLLKKSNSKDKKQLSFKSEVPRELNNVSTEGENPESKSSIWQSLKSFANGILGIWRS